MAGDRHITNGIYREPAKVETIAVRGGEIEFQLRISREHQERIARRKYKYVLLPNGGIDVIGSSNDSVFVFAILKHAWSWDGKVIVRKDPETGDTTIFAPDSGAEK